MSEIIFNSEILQNNSKINIDNTSQTFNDSKSLNNSKRYKHYLPNIGRLGQFNKNLNRNNSNCLNSTNELTINVRSYSNKQMKKIPDNLKIYHYYDSINNNIRNFKNDDDLDNFENDINKSNKIKKKKIKIKNTVINNLYNPSNSIYKDLALEKSKMIDIIHLKNNSYSNSHNKTKRKICIENIPITNFLNTKKNENDLLITDLNYYPIITALDEKNLNISEKNRYQNIMEEFYKLKNLIIKNPDEETQIINEFLLNHHIDDIELYDINKINNFSNF